MSERKYKKDLVRTTLIQQQLTQPVRILNFPTSSQQGNLTTNLPTKPSASAAETRPARESARKAGSQPVRELVRPASQSNQWQSQSQSQSQRQPQSRRRSQSQSQSWRVSQSPLRARKREPNSASHQPTQRGLPSALVTPLPSSLSSLHSPPLPCLPSLAGTPSLHFYMHVWTT